MKQTKLIVNETFHSNDEEEKKALLQKKIEHYLKNKLKAAEK